MRQNQIAAQCYTIRDHCRNAADFATSMRKVRAIGYSAVQISGVSGDIPAAEIRRICDGEGLAICATHEPGKMICEETQQVIDRLGVLGCAYTAYPYPHVPFWTRPEIDVLAAQLDAAGEKLRKAGQVLCYHNHDHEFVKVDGRSVLEWIYDLTRPLNLQAEPDTYWVHAGGGDCTAWCRRLQGRLPLLHLKDYMVVRKVGADGKQSIEKTMAEVGNGQLDWTSIIPAAEASGCRWFIVEQDVCPADPFDSLRQSWRHLQGLANG